MNGFEHPLLESLLPTASLMIEGKEQSVGHVLQLMEEIEKFPGEWGVLNIVYFSCDDSNGYVDRKYEEIRRVWTHKSYRS